MRSSLGWLAVGVLGLLTFIWPAAVHGAQANGPGPGDIAALTAAELKPGEAIKIDDPATGGLGYWMLYVPSDYVPTRKWPVIFSFHGLGLQPTPWPFQQATDGKGYIVVGMEYENRDLEGGTDKDMPNLKRIHDALSKKLALDDRMQFIGGFSQGGFRTIGYSDSMIDSWAGVIIMSAGRAADGGNVTNYKGKPIFISAGETDPNLQTAHSAADFYKAHNADVTMEVFPKTGHSVDTNDAVFKKWLLDHGPLTYVKGTFDDAKALDKAGKKGQAYAKYQLVLKQISAGDMFDQATSAAAGIEADAGKASSDAEADLSAGKISSALRKFILASQTYAGSALGDKAAARLKELKADPTIGAQLDQTAIDSAADQAEGRAAGEEKSGDFKSAIADYQAYVKAFPKSHHIDAVRAHLQSLENDPAIQAKIKSTQPDIDCKRWLSLADSYIHNGDNDHAKVYLQKIIDNYPDSNWAETAKKELQDLQ